MNKHEKGEWTKKWNKRMNKWKNKNKQKKERKWRKKRKKKDITTEWTIERKKEEYWGRVINHSCRPSECFGSFCSCSLCVCAAETRPVWCHTSSTSLEEMMHIYMLGWPLCHWEWGSSGGAFRGIHPLSTALIPSPDRAHTLTGHF